LAPASDGSRAPRSGRPARELSRRPCAGAIRARRKSYAKHGKTPLMSHSYLPRLRRVFAAGTVVAGLAILMPGQPQAAENEVVARVDGVEITQKDLDMALGDIQESVPQMSPAEQRDYLITYLADLELVAAAAEAAGVSDEEDFKRRLDYMRKRNLMETYLAREGEAAATEEAAKALYEKVLKDIPAQERVRARHILVETEEEAKAIRAEIDAGKDFAEIAKEKSKDPGSGAEGGELGWFTADQMVPEFSDAAFALDVGEISQPVKSDFGWHIIKVEEKRDKPGYDEVESELYQMLARQKQRDIILSLRASGKVERLDKPAEEQEEKKPE
jgi:peptidyl-prolyl cis-trans isomerase C